MSRFNEKEYSQEFLNLLSSGDEEAFSQFFIQNYDSVFGYFRNRITNTDQEVIEDLVQDTFLKFWEKIQTQKFRPENAKGYLFVLRHDSLVDYFRTSNRLKPDLEIEDEIMGTESLENDETFKELESGILSVISDLIKKRILSASDVELIVDRFVFDLSYKEIIERRRVKNGYSGQSEVALRTNMNRVLNRVRRVCLRKLYQVLHQLESENAIEPIKTTHYYLKGKKPKQRQSS